MSEKRKDWAAIAADAHFPEPVDSDLLRASPEVYAFAKWLYQANGTEFAGGDCYECDALAKNAP